MDGISAINFEVARLHFLRKDFAIRRRDDNENVKTTIGLSRQSNNFAPASRFFVHFFAVFVRLQREIAELYFLGRT